MRGGESAFLPNDVVVSPGGNLTVVSTHMGLSPSGRRQRRIKVVCFCGNKFETSANSLQTGGTKSCGCLAFAQRARNGRKNAEKRAVLTRVEKGLDQNTPITTENYRRHRECSETKKWVMRVRDNFTCQHCGQRGGKLQVHHTYPIKTHPELSNDPRYMITLCEDFHKTKVHPAGDHHAIDILIQIQLLQILENIYRVGGDWQEQPQTIGGH